MNINDIRETVHMLDEEKLDIRTVTISIPLFDCISSSGEETRRKIYDKITHESENLVKISDKIGDKYGVSIVNKRISVTPVSFIAASSDETNYTPYAKTLDKAAKAVGVDFIGGFSALVPKRCSKKDEILLDSIPEALSETDLVCSSINIGTTKAGINMDAIKKLGSIVKQTAYLTREHDGLGCAKLVVFCNAVEDNPFMAGAFCGTSESDTTINVGISGPGVVKYALEKIKGEPLQNVSETIKKTSFKITRMGELIGKEVAKKLGYPFGIVDLSLAPTPAVGDSVARILEEIGLEYAGGHGTTAALALLNDAVKKGGIMASSHVGGLSGAFIPVSEDEGMISAAESGKLTLDKLEAMTCVCSVGLDMIAIPGDTSKNVISAIIADECAIGMINQKTTAVRVIPVYGKKEGDVAQFGGLLGEAPIIAVQNAETVPMIERGGFIPAPLHSFKN